MPGTAGGSATWSADLAYLLGLHQGGHPAFEDSPVRQAGAVIPVADTAPPDEMVVNGERFTLTTVAGVPTALG